MLSLHQQTIVDEAFARPRPPHGPGRAAGSAGLRWSRPGCRRWLSSRGSRRKFILEVRCHLPSLHLRRAGGLCPAFVRRSARGRRRRGAPGETAARCGGDRRVPRCVWELLRLWLLCFSLEGCCLPPGLPAAKVEGRAKVASDPAGPGVSVPLGPQWPFCIPKSPFERPVGF